jgi:hypothetical protein
LCCWKSSNIRAPFIRTKEMPNIVHFWLKVQCFLFFDSSQCSDFESCNWVNNFNYWHYCWGKKSDA